MVRFVLLLVGIAFSFAARAAVDPKNFATEDDPDTFLARCSEALNPQGVVCVRAKDFAPGDKHRLPWSDIESTKEFQEAARRFGGRAVAIDGKGLPIFVVAYRKKASQYEEWVSSAYLAGGWLHATQEQREAVKEILTQLRAWPEGSEQYRRLRMTKNDKENEQRLAANKARAQQFAAERAGREQERQREEAEFEVARANTKPTCIDVMVTGLIASSVGDVEALHAPHLTAADLEDVIARHPYSCSINSFGVAYGCRGGAFVSARRATVKNWTPTHYVIEIPLEFQMGRRDAPAWVRRSEVKCWR